jgi:hypothetical protein
MTEALHDIYSDGRMLYPKSMEIEARFTTMAEDLNDYSNGGGTLYVHFYNSAIQTRTSNCAAICDNPLQLH